MLARIKLPNTASEQLPPTLSNTTPKPKVLVVDDEPMFGRMMEALAHKLGISITVCHSVEELAHLVERDFDIGVIDYDLGAQGPVTGVELASYLEVFLESIACVLTSQSSSLASKEWPASIRQFVPKALGPHAILDAALSEYRRRGNAG